LQAHQELLNWLIKKYGSKLKDKNKDKKSIDNNESAILITKSTKKPETVKKVPVKKRLYCEDQF